MKTTLDQNEDYADFGDIPHLSLELVLHTAAEAGRIMDLRDIEGVSDQERVERAGAMLVSLAREHFEQNPESEYIDFLQNPEFERIKQLIVNGEDKNIGWRFEYLGYFIDKQGMGLLRPSYQYFTEAYNNASADYFGIFKYPRNSSEYEELCFTSEEKKAAILNNRAKFQKREAA